MSGRGNDWEPSDAALVERLRTDPDALAELYKRHVASVARFAARRVYDADVVADVVSATFLAALHGAASFDSRRSPETARYWLFGIARNEIVNLQRASTRREAAARRARATYQLSEDETDRVDDLIEAQRLAPSVRAALDALPAKAREAFLLVTVDEVPPAAAAAILGISHSALRARLARARRQLRRRVQSAATPRVIHIGPIPSDLPGGTSGI